MKRIICMVLVFALIAAPSALAEGHRELENYTRSGILTISRK